MPEDQVTPEEVVAPIEEDTIVPVDETPVEDAPIEDVPAEETPVEDVPVEDAPIEDAPVEETPVEDVPVEDIPAPEEEVLAEDAPSAPIIPARVAIDQNGGVVLETPFRNQ